ncbi:MAG: PLP-dependent aminotransferase family protein [Sporomusaceae bacterium]|nr:PLP-dependent aminotransferase family protein [Sporomusaceae bacterium]
MPVNSFDNYPMSWKPEFNEKIGPLYKAIAEKLETDIRSGLLTPGTKLPPQRELADFLDINVSTISRAFKLCEQKGIICSTIGNGTFVSSDAAANPFLLHDEDSLEVIEMGPVFPAKSANRPIVTQLKKMITEPDFGELFQYGKSGGTLWQKETAAKLIGKAGYKVPSEQLLLSNGGQNAITAVLAGLFQPGDRIGTNEFTYPGIKTAANMLGIRLIPIQQNNNEMTADGILYACKNENIKGLYIIPDFHNPTTHTLSDTGRKTIAALAKQEDLIIIEDAIHSLLTEKPCPPVAAYAPEHVIYISSLAKVVSPGLRIAFLAVPEMYKQKLTEALYNMNISVAPMMAELVCRMIISGDLEKIIEKHRLVNKQRNEIVDTYLKNHKVWGSPEGIMRWLLLPKKMTGEEFAANAYQLGVRVYGAERFAVGNPKAVNAVRLAIAAPENDAQLEKAIKIIKNLLEQKSSH